MSAKDPPPYLNQDSQGTGVKVYHVHTPFTPPDQEQISPPSVISTVSTSRGGGGNEQNKPVFVDYSVGLDRSPGKATCTSCKKDIITEVHYKAGLYAWLMCILFICCGLFLCCCLIPFFLDSFKDAYHLCPTCNRVLHVEKKECCK